MDSYHWALHSHVTLVAASGVLFSVRGIAVLAGAPWPMRRAVRMTSYGIDALLLAAGVALLLLLRLDPLATGWLATKLGLLVLYIVAGSLALKRAPNRTVRVASYLAALLCFGLMVSVAVHHGARAL